jgi:hypothetical protein
MASFVIRHIDDGVWKQAKSKAALEGITMKQKIVELIVTWTKAPAASTKKRG